jgi:hemerythrin-like domain-containing protein
MNAIAVLKNDHRNVERLFERFERSRSAAERKRVADELVRELSVHATIEEQLVYPRLRQAFAADGGAGRTGRGDRARGRRAGRNRNRSHLPPGERGVFVALEEHHFAKLALVEIEKLAATDGRFEGKVHVLAESVRHHVEEEERDLLPVLERALSSAELDDLGEVLQKAKKLAPTRPHPAAPDEPPGNLLASAAASAYDRSLLALGRGMGAARGLVGRALRFGADTAGRARRTVGATARDAQGVARDVQDVARAARDAATSARASARRIARDAADVAAQSTQATLQ